MYLVSFIWIFDRDVCDVVQVWSSGVIGVMVRELVIGCLSVIDKLLLQSVNIARHLLAQHHCILDG